MRAFVEKHIAGDTLDFEVEVPDYPSSDGWTLKYYLTPQFSTPTQAPIVLTATGNADGSYQITAAPAVTALWKPGSYQWARRVEKSGAVQTLDEAGQLDVRPDPSATAQGDDARSHARKVLEAIEAVIEGRASTDQEEYTIGSRSLKRTPIEELLKLRSYYRTLVAGEAAQQGNYSQRLLSRL